MPETDPHLEEDKLTAEEEEVCQKFHWDPVRYLKRKKEATIHQTEKGTHARFVVPMSTPLREQIKEQISAWPSFVPGPIGQQSRAIRGWEMRDVLQCVEAYGVPLDGLRAILTRMQVPLTKGAAQVLLDHLRATSPDAAAVEMNESAKKPKLSARQRQVLLYLMGHPQASSSPKDVVAWFDLQGIQGPPNWYPGNRLPGPKEQRPLVPIYMDKANQVIKKRINVFVSKVKAYKENHNL